MSELREDAIRWFSAGVDAWKGNKELLVRVWRPGDGMSCTASGYQRRRPCGPPVAVCNSVLTEPTPSRHDRTVVSRVVCIRHLAKAFGCEAPTVAEGNSEKAALEELAQRHWDEYNAILAEHRDVLLRERLSSLPEELRDQVMAVMATLDAEGGDLS